MPITTTNIGSGTVETSAAGAVTDVANLQTLTGRPDGSTNLAAFNTASYRDSTYPAIGATATMKSALQSMVTHIDQLNVFNVLHYGADPTGASDSRAAIQAAIDAAYAKRQSISSSTSSSINDQLQAPVYFPKGVYRIDGPLVRSDHCVHLIGDRAVLTAGSAFQTNHPYGWALELGEQTTNTAMVDTIIKGLTFTEFRRHIRMGNARNNVNLGRIFVENCKFIGRHDYPTLSVRIYNRSADAVFYRCTWDVVDVAIDVQSCDKVAVYDSRCQLGTYHEWTANYAGKLGQTGYTAGDVVYAEVGGVWRLYERVDTTYPSEATFGPAQTPADNSKWTKLQDVDAYTGLFRLQRGRLLISNFVGNPILTGYQRTNPYSWVLAQDYAPWAASRGYIEGDMIAQAYAAGGNSNVFWARKTGQDGMSGASWDATERNKWLICGAPTYESDASKATYVANDVVRVNDVSFYRATTSTSGNFNAAHWELLETLSNSTASDSISVWTSVKVVNESFFGAEGANNGMGLVTWNASDRLTANGKQANLGARYISECVVKDSYLASGRKVGTEELVPAVLLVQLPQTLIVKDNMWNDSYKCVAAAYRTGATPPTRPGPNSDGNSRFNCFRTDISGNYGGAAGTVQTIESATLYRDFSPNWAPDDLLAITLPQYSAATSNPVLGEGDYFVASNASAVEHNAFINTTEGKQFTIRFQSPVYAVTGVHDGSPSDVLTAVGHNFVNGDVVRFSAISGGSGLFTVVNYYVIDRSGDTFRLSATSGGSAVNFTSNLTTGSRIYRVKSQHTLKHEPSYLHLREQRNVNPPADSWMTFEVRNGVAWETSRSFDGKFLSVTPGSGIPGGNAYRATVEWRHDLIYTRIYIDLAEGFSSGGAADDAIGADGNANPAHIGRIFNTDVGTIIAGRMYILETPAGGDTDIDLLASGSGVVAEDAAVTSPTRLVNSGTWAAGDTKALTALPSNLQYLYLAGQTPTAGAYTAGQVMIELIGTL